LNTERISDFIKVFSLYQRQLIFELIELPLYMLGNNVSGTPEIAISVRTKAQIMVRIFRAFSIH